jgi:hypothetical protein
MKNQFVDKHANQHTDGNRGEIEPGERGAEHEVTQRCAAY